MKNRYTIPLSVLAGAAICLLITLAVSKYTGSLSSSNSLESDNQSLSLGIGGSIESDRAFIEVLSPSSVDDLRSAEGTWESFIHADPDMAAKTLEIAAPKWEQTLKNDTEYHDVKKIIKRLQTQVMEEQSQMPVSGGGK